MHKTENILEAKQFVQNKTDIVPTIGIILGSGLGALADKIMDAVRIPYNEIPHFSQSKAIGHANELVIGKLNGQNIVAMKGRFHYYEGISLEKVTFPVRLMKALGVGKLSHTTTTSSGGLLLAL